MRKRYLGLGVLVTLFASLPVPSARASLVVIDDARYVNAGPFVRVDATPGVSLFQATVPDPPAYISAFQSTDLQATQMGGEGGVGAAGPASGVDLHDVDVHSVFDVTFQVTEAGWFRLLGNRHGDVAGLGSFSSSTGDSQALDGDFFTQGLLVPGVDYRLIFSATETLLQGGQSAFWQFTFNVPEPALWLLSLVGLAPLLRARAPVARGGGS